MARTVAGSVAVVSSRSFPAGQRVRQNYVGFIWERTLVSSSPSRSAGPSYTASAPASSRSVRGMPPHSTPTARIPQQILGAFQRRQSVEAGSVQRGVRGAEPGVLVLVLVTVLAEEVGEQVVGAEADRPVDVMHRHVVSGLSQHLPPRHHIQVVGVDERAVHVEQSRAGHVLRVRRCVRSGFVLAFRAAPPAGYAEVAGRPARLGAARRGTRGALAEPGSLRVPRWVLRLGSVATRDCHGVSRRGTATRPSRADAGDSMPPSRQRPRASRSSCLFIDDRPSMLRFFASSYS